MPLMPLALALLGCAILDKVEETKDKIEDLKDVVAGLTNPMVTQGIILGVQEPEDPTIQSIVSQTEFGSGTTVSVFLADAASADEVESAPISGAVVTLDDGVAPAVADEEQGGVYTITPGVLPYVDEATWGLTVEVAEEIGALDVFLPAAADVDVPDAWTAGDDMVLDMSGLGFDYAFAVVMDENGNVTWTNEPTSATDLLGITQGEDGFSELVIPGAQAFPAQSFYIVGLAGMVQSDDSTIDNMNTILSSVMCGKMRFFAVSTVDLPDLP